MTNGDETCSQISMLISGRSHHESSDVIFSRDKEKMESDAPALHFPQIFISRLISILMLLAYLDVICDRNYISIDASGRRCIHYATHVESKSNWKSNRISSVK